MQEKQKNNRYSVRNLLYGLAFIFWLGIVGLLQFPIYDLLSENISDTQTVMSITAIISLSLYISGIIVILHRIYRGQRKQVPKLKNENRGGKSQLRLAVYAFLWLWFVVMIHILAYTFLPRYFPAIDMQSEFFSFLTPVLYMSGALVIMYWHHKADAS